MRNAKTKKYLEKIGCPSKSLLCNPVEDVSNEVKDQLKDLEKAAEGDAKPERETAAQSAEQTPILNSTHLTTKTLLSSTSRLYSITSSMIFSFSDV